MKHLSNPCKQYLQQAKKYVPDSLNNRKETLIHLRISLANYSSEHPEHTYEDLIEQFGNPEKIADLALSDSELHNAHKIKKRNRLIIIISTILLIIFTGIMVTLLVEHNQSAATSGEITIENLGTDNE